MKKVLFIAYYFPPIGQAGVHRPAKFAKYLPQYGWKPIVLSADPAYYPSAYETSTSDTRGTEVHYVRSFVNFRKVATYYASDSPLKDQFIKDRKILILLKPLLRKINSIVYHFLIPDYHVLWQFFALVKGIKECKKQKIRAIYATGDPFSSFITAFYLGKIFKIPYIVDFRDPWMRKPVTGIGRIRRYIENRLESIIVSCAYRVVSTSKRTTNAFITHYKNEEAKKFKTITNGYDEEDFRGYALERSFKAAKTTNSKIVIGYIGSLYKNRTPEPIFKGVSHLFKLHPELKKKVLLEFFGTFEASHMDLLEIYGLMDNTLVHKGIWGDEKYDFYLRTNILLIIEYIIQDAIPGKFYEYLRVGKPILALGCKNGALDEIISETDSGILVAPDHTDQIAAVIYDLIHRKKTFTSPRKTIQKYDRKVLTKDLSEILNRATA